MAVNGAGEVAFQQTLSDGRLGIFLASPAEAVASAGSSGLAALALLIGDAGLFALRSRLAAA